MTVIRVPVFKIKKQCIGSQLEEPLRYNVIVTLGACSVEMAAPGFPVEANVR